MHVPYRPQPPFLTALDPLTHDFSWEPCFLNLSVLDILACDPLSQALTAHVPVVLPSIPPHGFSSLSYHPVQVFHVAHFSVHKLMSPSHLANPHFGHPPIEVSILRSLGLSHTDFFVATLLLLSLFASPLWLLYYDSVKAISASLCCCISACFS